LNYQDYREWLRVLPLNPMECETERKDWASARERVRSRLDVEHMDFEPFFLRYYERMNDLERAEFAELRRITQGPIRGGNLTVFNVLSQNPALFSEAPELAAL
jgi:hypothetical protein